MAGLTHTASRYVHRTHSINGSGNKKGALKIGHVRARAAIEERIGRPLREPVTIKKTKGTWRFIEAAK